MFSTNPINGITTKPTPTFAIKFSGPKVSLFTRTVSFENCWILSAQTPQKILGLFWDRFVVFVRTAYIFKQNLLFPVFYQFMEPLILGATTQTHTLLMCSLQVPVYFCSGNSHYLQKSGNLVKLFRFWRWLLVVPFIVSFLSLFNLNFEAQWIEFRIVMLFYICSSNNGCKVIWQGQIIQPSCCVEKDPHHLGLTSRG